MKTMAADWWVEELDGERPEDHIGNPFSAQDQDLCCVSIEFVEARNLPLAYKTPHAVPEPPVAPLEPSEQPVLKGRWHLHYERNDADTP